MVGVEAGVAGGGRSGRSRTWTSICGKAISILFSANKSLMWLSSSLRVLTRSPDAPGVERAQAKRVVFETDADVPYQIDGDAVGRCRRLEASVLPASVTVMAP